MDRSWPLVSVGKGRREKSVQKDFWVLALGDSVNGEALIRPKETAGGASWLSFPFPG